MNFPTLPDVTLPNGVTLSDKTKEQLIWGGHETGISWLRTLSSTLADWCDRWQITLKPEMPEVSFNLVLFGTSPKHGSVIIKTSPPHEEVLAEIEALRANQRPGIVRLIDADPGVSIMLQERITPGTPLRNLTDSGAMSDQEATTLAATAMKSYWKVVAQKKTFLKLDRWFESLYAYQSQHPNGGGPIPADLVSLAIRHADHLLATQGEHVTLHGDLHHQNILWDETKGWTIIDPKGLIGERGYDIATWMLNPFGLHAWPNLTEVTNNRLTSFSNRLEIDRYRLWQWAVVHSVLSECWSIGGQTGDELHAMVISRALTQLPEASR